MSKQKKIGDNPVTELEMKGCVVAPRIHQTCPFIDIRKTKSDPGAVYILFRTIGGWFGVLRAVYDSTRARNIPKINKPETMMYQVKAGMDDVIVMIGNYNICGDIDKLTDKDHSIIDDLMLIMESNAEHKTLHDADGFIRLLYCSGFNVNQLRYNPSMRKPRSYRNPYEISIRCGDIGKDDTDIINLVNTIAMFTDRAEVSYTERYDHGYYFYDTVVTAAAYRKILTKEPITVILEDMEGKQFDEVVINDFTEILSGMFTLSDDDRKKEKLRLARASKDYNPADEPIGDLF